MRNKRSGFTLLELIIVIIVIGILASIALPRYIQIAEKGRCAEAKSILSTIRSAQVRYYAQHGIFTTAIGDLDAAFTTPKYFTFVTTGATNAGVDIGTATRNGVDAGGTSPASYTVIVAENGTLSGTGSTYYQ